jgi:hypothetical protein
MTMTRITGGCQCGAVRYAVHSDPKGGAICHCRMCQKAFASPFGAFFSVSKDKFELTRGVIATFSTSAKVERGFCAKCGTPLTVDYTPSADINIAIVSLDDPQRIKPEVQIGVESRLPWLDIIGSLPAHTTSDAYADYGDVFAEIKSTNRQHPDHDTDRWPPPK